MMNKLAMCRAPIDIENNTQHPDEQLINNAIVDETNLPLTQLYGGFMYQG
jgi:hypothetical protein